MENSTEAASNFFELRGHILKLLGSYWYCELILNIKFSYREVKNQVFNFEITSKLRCHDRFSFEKKNLQNPAFILQSHFLRRNWDVVMMSDMVAMPSFWILEVLVNPGETIVIIFRTMLDFILFVKEIFSLILWYKTSLKICIA